MKDRGFSVKKGKLEIPYLKANVSFGGADVKIARFIATKSACGDCGSPEEWAIDVDIEVVRTKEVLAAAKFFGVASMGCRGCRKESGAPTG